MKILKIYKLKLLVVLLMVYVHNGIAQQNLLDSSIDFVKKITVADLLKNQENKANKKDEANKSSTQSQIDPASGIFATVKSLITSNSAKNVNSTNSSSQPTNQTSNNLPLSNNDINANGRSKSTAASSVKNSKGIQLYAVYGSTPNLRAVFMVNGERVDLGTGELNHGLQLVSIVGNSVKVSHNGKSLSFSIQ